MNRRDDFLPGFALLNFAIDTFLDKDLLKRSEKPLLVEFIELDAELLTNELFGMFRRNS